MAKSIDWKLKSKYSATPKKGTTNNNKNICIASKYQRGFKDGMASNMSWSYYSESSADCIEPSAAPQVHH